MLVKLFAPKGATSAGVGGVEYTVNEEGWAKVPEQFVATLRDHGWATTVAPEPATFLENLGHEDDTSGVNVGLVDALSEIAVLRAQLQSLQPTPEVTEVASFLADYPEDGATVLSMVRSRRASHEAGVTVDGDMHGPQQGAGAAEDQGAATNVAGDTGAGAETGTAGQDDGTAAGEAEDQGAGDEAGK